MQNGGSAGVEPGFENGQKVFQVYRLFGWPIFPRAGRWGASKSESPSDARGRNTKLLILLRNWVQPGSTGYNKVQPGWALVAHIVAHTTRNPLISLRFPADDDSDRWAALRLSLR